MNSNGIIQQAEDGQWQQEPDYVKALELYRRLTRVGAVASEEKAYSKLC
jgi:hypothetical protein